MLDTFLAVVFQNVPFIQRASSSYWYFGFFFHKIVVKETKSATMNIFRFFFYFVFLNHW